MIITTDWPAVCGRFLDHALANRAVDTDQLMRLCCEYEKSDFTGFAEIARKYKNNDSLATIRDYQDQWQVGDLSNYLYVRLPGRILGSLQSGRRYETRRCIHELVVQSIDNYADYEKVALAVSLCVKTVIGYRSAASSLEEAQAYLASCDAKVIA